LKIIVLGGDGFCGWPTALHLSARGHEVAIVDNLSRRKIDLELEVQSLTPIQPMPERLAAWKEISGKTIAPRTCRRMRTDPAVGPLTSCAARCNHHFASSAG